MDDLHNLHNISAKRFVDYCKDKLGWSDLSNDVIMDLGCGEHGYCGKAILEKFPDVRAIIGIDKDPHIARKFRESTKTRMECDVADLLNRQSLKSYEGRMAKVISTHVLHQVDEKEEALRNVFHLLKPGGEAAFLFVTRSLIYEWLTEMLKNPKWKGFYQRRYVEDMYKSGLGMTQYKEIAEKIGFQILECSEKMIVIPYPSDKACKDALYEMCGNSFKIPPEIVEEFKEECFQLLVKLSGRSDEGKPCYKSIELSLLLVKPSAKASDSKTN